MIIVFDFDGTMADSLTVIRQMYNERAPEYGLRTIDEADWQRIRRMNFKEMLRFAQLKPYQLPKYITLGKKLLTEHSDRIGLFPGIAEVVKQLHADGHQLFVLSTNSQAVVQAILNRSGLSDHMTVMKSSKIFGKAQPLKRLIKQSGIQATDMWVIGDETRDAQAAHKAGARPLSVTWGFHPPEVLATAKPSAVANKPRDILTIINREA